MEKDPISRGEHTRSQIVRAAYRLFHSQGYHGTSMRQIAQEAGIAVGGIYNHFPGKEEIFIAVLDAYHPYHGILRALEQPYGENAEDFIRQAASVMVQELERSPEFLNLFLVEIVEFNARHVPQIFASVFPRMAPFILRFQEQSGELRPLPLPILFRAFLGLFFSYYVTGKLMGGQLPPEFSQNDLQHFIDIFLHGVLARTPDSGSKPGAEGEAADG
jgi:AcrR family transcriptional regulator